MPYYVYILKSLEHNRRYIGSCEDLDVRLKRHSSGKVRSSKAYAPYRIPPLLVLSPTTTQPTPPSP